jgi:diguanylate cyclase (GGDEF)-like protein/putative nucleotidyltransferase with HDIG domain
MSTMTTMTRVLLADDEEALRLMLGRQLRRAGHEVTLAEDGLVAAGFLETETFDVVVSDMKMPRLDGMGLLERAAHLAPDTEFIILTGHGSAENALEAFKRGNVFDYLLKPLEDIHELDAVVARAVERRRLRGENGRLVTELRARIDELEAAKRELAFFAERDGLTGLYNHKTIHEKLAEALLADPGAPTAMLLLDMDGFKLLNDTYGHPTGDQALRYIGGALRTVCGVGGERDPAAGGGGEAVFLGRCGGDEFMVVLPRTDGERAGALAESIRAYLNDNPFPIPDGGRLPLQLCIGVADSAMAGRTSATLVAAADAALYESKQNGGNQVTLHLVDTDAGENDPARSTFNVLESLVTAIDRKDRYTKRHSEDVTNYALRLAEALTLSEDTYNAVRVAGLLHDVGKIGVPDAILRKPGKLTADEYEVIKGHVTVSALIIHGLPRLPDVLDAVANHHERWDGRGYPRGVSGYDIPLLGRIMAVADAFSAMTLDRPYRAGMSVEEALEEIERGAGTQFDPELARVFVETFRQKAPRKAAA